MCAYAVFTGGRGRIPITLRLCFDAEYTKDLMRLNGTLEFPPGNPNAVVDLTYEIRGFVFTQFGGYTFELLCDEVPILSRRFMVKEPPSPPQRPHRPPGRPGGGRFSPISPAIERSMVRRPSLSVGGARRST